jgi:anti-sigma B factor antagonist
MGNEPKFIINLQSLEFIDSTGLGGLVSCLKRCIEAGGDLKIAQLPAKPRMVFEITRAHKVFDIFDDLETAIESYE